MELVTSKPIKLIHFCRNLTNILCRDAQINIVLILNFMAEITGQLPHWNSHFSVTL